MRIRGGYTPRISGRPLSVVEETALPDRLFLSLERGGVRYSPLVKAGQKIAFGEPLAEAQIDGGKIQIPAPSSGKVARAGSGAAEIVLENVTAETSTSRFRAHQPERISAEDIRSILAQGGIWPFFWSTRTAGLPSLSGEFKPRAIVVNCVLAEPFRARGKILIQRGWDRIIKGIRFFPRLLADYGRVEVILTAVGTPVARQMYADLAGDAWVRLHPVPVLYPIENPRVLVAAIRRAIPAFGREDEMWVIDVQGMEALGACLAQGLPLHRRIVATGGPGASQPRHHEVRIGTRVELLAPEAKDEGRVRVLRGGLFTGNPVRGSEAAVQYDDDSFFLLPEASRRKFLGFLRPGFDRTSYLPCFATTLTRAPDRSISTLLRGERRPCIACGLCERICPAGLMPQVLHRYLYRDATEQAEKAGLDRCVDCDLCTFVCPSKIELQQQFFETRRKLREEREAERAATGAPGGSGSAKEDSR